MSMGEGATAPGREQAYVKVQVEAQVAEEPADHGRQVNHVCGLVLLEDFPRGLVVAGASEKALLRIPTTTFDLSFPIPQIAGLGAEKHPLLVGLGLERGDLLNRLAHQARPTRDQHHHRLRCCRHLDRSDDNCLIRKVTVVPCSS